MSKSPPSLNSLQAADCDALVDALSTRCLWPPVRDALRAKNLPPGTGWKDLKQALHSAPNRDEIAAAVMDFYRAHLLAGSRYVQLYELAESDARAAAAYFSAHKPRDSSFLRTFPLPLSEEQLRAEEDGLQMVEIRTLEHGDVALTFASRRYVELTQPVDPKTLSDQVRAVFGSPDEIYTVRKTHRQGFDVVVIRPKLQRVEVLLDLAASKPADLDYAAIELLGAAASHCSHLVPVYQAATPVNVYPAINSLYTDIVDKEGTVLELRHRTSTGSLKIEKMPKRDDLRTEAFHTGGLAAVQKKISPYEVRMAYTFRLPPGEAVVQLAASPRSLGIEDPSLLGFFCRDGACITDVEHSINKVVSHI